MTAGSTTDRSPPREIRRGDIFWVSASVEGNAEGGVAHPHVVLQDDVFNRSRVHTIIVCAVTSNLKRSNEPGNVLLEVGEGDLPRQSVLVVSQISSVARSELGAYIGALSPERIEQALDGLRFQQASFFNRQLATDPRKE
jgi:mRNA interferase MazF